MYPFCSSNPLPLHIQVSLPRISHLRFWIAFPMVSSTSLSSSACLCSSFTRILSSFIASLTSRFHALCTHCVRAFCVRLRLLLPPTVATTATIEAEDRNSEYSSKYSSYCCVSHTLLLFGPHPSPLCPYLSTHSTSYSTRGCTDIFHSCGQRPLAYWVSSPAPCAGQSTNSLSQTKSFRLQVQCRASSSQLQ